MQMPGSPASVLAYLRMSACPSGVQAVVAVLGRTSHATRRESQLLATIPLSPTVRLQQPNSSAAELAWSLQGMSGWT